MRKIHYEELPVNDLYIAVYNNENKIGYNRTIMKSWANNISKNFDIKQFGTIQVSNRDGIYYIIDGQHRVQAAKHRSMKTVPCQVHECLTYEEEADLFVNLSKRRKSLTVNDTFKAECESGDLASVDLRIAAKSAGYDIGIGSGTYKIQAVNVLKKIYSVDGPEAVKEVLEIMSSAWKGDQKSSIRVILLGLWRFTGVYHHEYGRVRLINVLQKTPPAEIVRGVKGDVSGRSMATSAAMVILNLYNRGLTKRLVNRFE